ncbi:hypothetical protein [Croceicoccus estronivorus]|nr:hypothetical protein [Croceicoccus estronivorus]
MAGRRYWWVLAAFVVLVFAYALIQGGEEPMREISEPVATPGDSA